ncbi:hypothetical protein ABZ848_41605 [Streptomyces sp. NPDC047081]
MDHEQDSSDTSTVDEVTARPPTKASPASMDAEDESALEPHIVRGLD